MMSLLTSELVDYVSKSGVSQLLPIVNLLIALVTPCSCQNGRTMAVLCRYLIPGGLVQLFVDELVNDKVKDSIEIIFYVHWYVHMQSCTLLEPFKFLFVTLYECLSSFIVWLNCCNSLHYFITCLDSCTSLISFPTLTAATVFIILLPDWTAATVFSHKSCSEFDISEERSTCPATVNKSHRSRRRRLRHSSVRRT